MGRVKSNFKMQSAELSGSSTGPAIVHHRAIRTSATAQTVPLEAANDTSGRVSNLFYLQLNSSLAQRQKELLDQRNKRKPIIVLPEDVAKYDLSLSRQVSTMSDGPQQERDVGDSFHPQNQHRDQAEEATVRNQTQAMARKEISIRQSQKRIEPVLNDRMKDLANFSLRFVAANSLNDLTFRLMPVRYNE